MGGRSREYPQSDRWAWVQELSDYRLERYGMMSWHKSDQYEDTIRKGALNYALTQEYERRNGVKPEWEYREHDRQVRDYLKSKK